ncbi:transcriptional regulatory protein [Biomphalaria glabrata]|uniref:Probable transcriptional regulatory protein Teth514_1449 n=1 Tax=Biomphalaria glabrata TaxID=6526 RepID=A0A2C9LN53_BIOGL|nr:probable transcriptional regulatory protein Teth514_1449 [Biomphalaria glabrata]XP_055882392.1 probable transcriptional regulatory protein Teth514_1449 [Biomphalaria glabrata]XP_055882402.1 probable transcriptional regulatory protein Teth514_1449 [Biomphalaria glabrata]XP_055882410.1 probable transcriptional regulatory protein Teth514_1449 [Biomphalaria glabrata]KAI8755525.1 putative transcriptional regulatory protein [Biomphalaria glabrata]KAI8793041.1 transcriptional regulatory protein [B
MASSRYLGRVPKADTFVRSITFHHQVLPVFIPKMCLQHSFSQVSRTSLFNQIIPRNSVRFLHLSSCLAAGHSKWHNIKHIKAANDRIKGQKSSFLAKKLQILFMKNSEKDPKLNSELANLIKWARSNNIPNDVIDNTIDRQIKLRDPKNLVVFEGRGFSNTGIVIECFSLKPHHTKGILQSIVRKCGFNLNSSASDLFDYKGVIEVPLSEEEIKSIPSDISLFPLDKYVDLAIEAEAEEVTLQVDEEGPYLRFLCAPFDLDKVSKNVQNLGLNIVSSERCYLPKVSVPVSQEFLDSLDKLIEKLDLNPDVVNYYFNVELEKLTGQQ